jgi:prepilin-type N-terminal cleavage/methylation domain-containing protein
MYRAMYRKRGGFTLVELLVVIAIIGTLMTLTTAAVWRAIQKAKEAKISVEIDHLSQAVQAYKERQVAFPPSLSNAVVTDRQLAFMRHVQVAFPNCVYGTAAGNFGTLTNSVALTNSGYWAYNYLTPSGSTAALNLYTLDQAESLVFWLAGFPTPINISTKMPVAGRKMFGFHRDSDNPFKRDPTNVEGLEPLRFRTDPTFQFDPLRLVDNDGDGWPEYVPVTPSTGSPTAPYVYFDADAYTDSTSQKIIKHLCYPRITDTNTSTMAAQLASQWGVAAPMALFFDPSGANPTRWAKDTSFQIICAGLDGIYSTPATDLTKGQRIPVYPSGQVYDANSGFTTQTYYSNFDLDNLTNIAGKNLEGARNEAQQ